MGKWFPINSAPKDGNTIMIKGQQNGYPKSESSMWCPYSGAWIRERYPLDGGDPILINYVATHWRFDETIT